MSKRDYHETLRLENFTAFEDASFSFVPGVNVLVGENGTGKTHVMKALYAWQRMTQAGNRTPQNLFPSVYQVPDEGDLVRWNDRKSAIGVLEGRFGDSEWMHRLLRVNVADLQPWMKAPVKTSSPAKDLDPSTPRPVFIPAIDMMGHTKGFVQTYDEFAIDFDLTHRDIVSLLLSPEKRAITETQGAISEPLESILGGTLEVEGERFFLVTPKGRLPMPEIAEGLRKIATLLRLVQGGWLRPGATLFWDEPEVNVNPILMDEVIAAILALARSGVQVFLATHSYVILKELDLQTASEPGLVKYFSLYNAEAGTKVNTSDNLEGLEPNPILAQYDSLYDRQLTRATKRNRSGERVD